MTRASKAALLSGLIFPGAGHISLRQYQRGSTLILAALVAYSIIIRSIFQQALTIVDRINSSDILLDTGAITEMVGSSTSGTNNLLENIALIVLLACWLFGIIDSYRLGIAGEK